ncbi:hypothetical protein SRHO_G00302220 [Serrasalmus rhombeus]
MDRRIAKLVKAQPMIGSKRIKEDLQLTVSTGTIRRRLVEINLPARSPRKVPLLNKRHVQKRLEFAKEHIEWPEKKWRNILWTDESKVLLFGSKGHRHGGPQLCVMCSGLPLVASGSYCAARELRILYTGRPLCSMKSHQTRRSAVQSHAVKNNRHAEHVCPQSSAPSFQPEQLHPEAIFTFHATLNAFCVLEFRKRTIYHCNMEYI